MNLREVLLEWKEAKIPELIPRERKVSFDSYIISIIGPRRAGKTYFMFQLMKELEEKNYKRDEIVYIDFSDPRTKFDDISEFLKTISSLFSSSAFLFLDEIQEVKNWESFVRTLHNLRRYKIIISGSSSKLLSREIATQLRGRSIDAIIFPFSFREFLRAKNFEMGREISKVKEGEVLRNLNEYLEFGGYPEIILEKNVEMKKEMIKTYFTTVFYRDIVERFKIRNLFLMEYLMKYCMANLSSYFSLSKFYDVVKSQIPVSKKTIAIYWRSLLDALLIFPIHRFSFKFKGRSLYPVKVYCIDNAYFLLEPRFSRDFGKKMENAVATELFKKLLENVIDGVFYFKTNNREVDFVLKEGLRVKQLIQVTYESSKGEVEEDADALSKAYKFFEKDDPELLIITWDYEDVLEENNTEIKCIPLWKWLLNVK